MKNNKIYKIIRLALVMVAVVVTNSCNESFLDGPKPNGPTEEDYFFTELDFERGTWATYAKMNDWYAWNGGIASNAPNFTLWVLPGDDATTTGGGEYVAPEAFGTLSPSNQVVTRFYNAAYQIIGRSNVMLEKIEEVADGIYTTPNLKDYNKGEALFLRGYVYFNLWNYFGTSPLVTTRLKSTEDAFLPPTSGTDLLDQAIKDFEESATLLPAAWSAVDRGRATKNSANGMLGKALVFRATVTNTSADYTAALAAFNKITGVSLTAAFDDNHAFDTENNSESLFEFQASQSGGDNIWLPNDFDNNVGSMSTAGYVGFQNINNWGYGGAQIIATQKALDMFDPADPRLPLTIDAATRVVTKYSLRDQKNGVAASSLNNPRILRYADILLLKAEATLQSGGSKSEAIGYINEVRKRARDMVGGGLVPADLNTGETDAGTIMQWVMDERFLELAFEEGHRWWDLRRWAMAETITLNGAFFDSDNANFSFEYPKHLYMPIPLSEMDRNPEMKQNPNY